MSVYTLPMFKKVSTSQRFMIDAKRLQRIDMRLILARNFGKNASRYGTRASCDETHLTGSHQSFCDMSVKGFGQSVALGDSKIDQIGLCCHSLEVQIALRGFAVRLHVYLWQIWLDKDL